MKIRKAIIFSALFFSSCIPTKNSVDIAFKEQTKRINVLNELVEGVVFIDIENDMLSLEEAKQGNDLDAVIFFSGQVEKRKTIGKRLNKERQTPPPVVKSIIPTEDFEIFGLPVGDIVTYAAILFGGGGAAVGGGKAVKAIKNRGQGSAPQPSNAPVTGALRNNIRRKDDE